MNPVRISVILSTYNQPEWLEKVLWGYHAQQYRDFEVIIADDGSGETTAKLIGEMRKAVFYPIVHAWHEDNGFRKNAILNKAITASHGAYIVVSDGDCIPRSDFLSVHDQYGEAGYFLSGGRVKLPVAVSEVITKDAILAGRCFDLKWLKDRGLKPSFRNNKLTSRGFKARLLNAVTPTKATWDGCNASGWKKDIIAVNGYDERMGYGGEDRELGERLVNYGIRSKQLRYTAVCVHLEHSRAYVCPDALAENKVIRKHTRKNKIIRTPYGIEQQEQGNR